MNVHDAGVGERQEIIGTLAMSFETPRAENGPCRSPGLVLVKRRKKGELVEKERKCEGYLYIRGTSHVPVLEDVKSILRVSMEYQRKRTPMCDM